MGIEYGMIISQLSPLNRLELFHCHRKSCLTKVEKLNGQDTTTFLYDIAGHRLQKTTKDGTT